MVSLIGCDRPKIEHAPNRPLALWTPGMYSLGMAPPLISDLKENPDPDSPGSNRMATSREKRVGTDQRMKYIPIGI